jgi:hypothetical protein
LKLMLVVIAFVQFVFGLEVNNLKHLASTRRWALLAFPASISMLQTQRIFALKSDFEPIFTHLLLI